MNEETKFEICEGLHKNVAALYEALEDGTNIDAAVQIDKIRTVLDSVDEKFLTKK